MPVEKIVPDAQPTEPPVNTDNVEVSSDGQRATIKTENVDTDARPEWLPEKFDSPEAMAKSYAELEKKFSSERNEPEAEPAEAESEEAPNDLKIEKAAQETVEKAGFDFDALGKEYAENNGLTDETYDAMEAKGLPRAVVDAYLEGQKAIGERIVNELAAVAGGPEGFKAAQEWAGQNLSEAELAGYNRAIDTQDYATAKIIMSGIVAQKNAAVGSDPNLVNAGTGPGRVTGAQPFASNAEMTAAINDPKYQTDPSYREMVARRILAG